MSVGSRLSRLGGVRGRSALGRLRGSERHEENEEVILQITSLADVFTILLVFLLKSTAASSIPAAPGKDLKLPSIAATGKEGAEVKPGAKVEVGMQGVLIEGDFAATLKEGRLDPQGAQTPGAARASVRQQFKKLRARQDWLLSQNAEIEKNTKILLMSDERIPYETLEWVWEEAAAEGFSEVQLLTAVRE